ncbi:hypothetical protein LTR91_025895 [Friedmanniomyces endolithicus]|uniref:Uncharacterized protein n=1 Tax=Friedmanniomyces endolithicus TaxID=329885 RepID=A0A4U0UK83_9PEZI|nr:hypothetical protein LTS09_017700 [Friedmanniomyces endolithicus]KAK0342368.1 hypothetical protein LTR94_022535 [Friedmanniomyces endolithicus]KAK0768087.1 hypothetical protein LTR59_017937 [Friedmanniomyces endolithicus]KAK0770320.1 hypothetical protein LTR75_017944 [Friedmanniomyces endolithicus]KAK0770590.1 hypothetical protein LTR38_017533 [Friedmanniomyces endolithicus]
MEGKKDALVKKGTTPEPSASTTVHTYEVRAEPLKLGVQRIFQRVVETGRLPGAPAAHKRFAEYVEYATAIVNSTTTVAEGITAQQLEAFAWGLPVLGGAR